MTTPATRPDLLEWVRTSGRSMTPLITDGSLVGFQPASPEDFVPGDIAVFRREGRMIVHRILAVRTNGAERELLEKGDHHPGAAWLSGKFLKGKAVRLTRGLVSRRLDISAQSRRLRLLTRFLCFEAMALEGYMTVRNANRATGWIRWPAKLIGLAAAPFRYALCRVLLTAYPRERPDPADDENTLLLSCFRNAGSIDTPGDGRAVAVRDWNRALGTLGRHGLSPIIGLMAASSSSATQFPAQVTQVSRRHSLRIALNHANALAALSDVSRELEAVAIPYAVLKGPYLYEWLYRDLFPREYEDIDVLVPAGLVEKSIAAFKRAGYECVGGRLTGAFLRRGHFHIRLNATRTDRPPIELHWSLVDRANLYRVHDEELFSRLCEFRTEANHFTVLSAEDELIYLCLHAVKHGVINFIGLRSGYPVEWFCGRTTGNRLLWFMDIHLLLRKERDRLDWRVVAERIRQWNAAEEVMECLRVLDQLHPNSAAAKAIERIGFPEAIVGVPASVKTSPRTMPASRFSFGSGMSHSQGPLARLLKTEAGQTLLERSMRMNPVALIRPIRLLLIGRILVPSPKRLLRYYGTDSRWRLPWLYILHPFHIFQKMLG